MSRESALTGLRSDQVGIVARYAMRFAIRTGSGLSTLLAVLIVGLTVASIFFAPVEALMEASPELGHDASEATAAVDRIAQDSTVSEAVTWVTGADKEQVTYLLRENPALLSGIFLIMLFLLPWLTTLGSFNQTSGDIGNRGLRYLLLRTERPNIFFGRFLGCVAFQAISFAVLLVLLLLYAALKFHLYPIGAMAFWALQAYAAFLILSIAYTALCAWISSAIDSAGGSMVICFLVAGFPIIFLKLLSGTVKGGIPWLDKLLPWGWKYDLLSHDIGKRLLAYAVLLGFTGLFLMLGARTFRRRDL